MPGLVRRSHRILPRQNRLNLHSISNTVHHLVDNDMEVAVRFIISEPHETPCLPLGIPHHFHQPAIEALIILLPSGD